MLCMQKLINQALNFFGFRYSRNNIRCLLLFILCHLYLHL